MTKVPSYPHGGDIWNCPAPPLDFSSNLHPLGMPPAYPDPFCRDLREAIARRDGAESAQVVCGGGAADRKSTRLNSSH